MPAYDKEQQAVDHTELGHDFDLDAPLDEEDRKAERRILLKLDVRKL